MEVDGPWGDQNRFTKLGYDFAKEGYVAILPTYRLYRDGPFPACLEDVKNAIRWTRAHAEKYNLDPGRIGAYGNSAGGTLALTAALTHCVQDLEGAGSFREFSSELQAVVASGVVGDMQDESHSKRAVFAYRNLATGGDPSVSDSKMKDMLRKASPSSYVRKDAPPILLVHGVKDEVVVIDSTDAFVQSMKKAKADITYLRFDDAGHSVMGQKGRQTKPAMMDFFKTHLQL